VIFVSVGTNEAPFDRLLEAVASLLLDEDVVVQHGHSARLGPPGARLLDFLSFEQMVEHIRAARVVVTHAGVGSVMVSLANGKRPVVVPRRKRFAEAVDDHQLQLGGRLAQAGLVTFADEPAGLADAIARHDGRATIVPATSSLAADIAGFLSSKIDQPADGGS
jgi:exopolysaccharide biosynthesis glucuronosyltransferase PssE